MPYTVYVNIQSLKITGFRNLKKLNLTFDSNVIAFVGKNGQGKTNILETIYLLALSKSFRSRINTDLIGFEDDFCRLEGQISVPDEDMKLEFILTRQPSQKVLKVNGVKKKAADFIGHLKAVFFSPDDLSDMAYAPRLRRRYLDILLSQMDRDYLEALSDYQEVLSQRNALLKRIREGEAQKSELTFWDEKLAGLSYLLITKRQDLLEGLKDKVQNHYKKISGKNNLLRLSYQTSIQNVSSPESVFSILKDYHSLDIASGNTQHGPHRDDILFTLNDHDMMYFASRGEWRSLVLALKFAEVEWIHDQIEDYPILLLDDVFSELDEERQHYLFEAVSNCQTFITTTHREFLEGIKEVKIFEVSEGQIEN